MSSRRQFHREKEIQEYEVDGGNRCPAKSISLKSNEERPMDEISLLKKGLITPGHHNLSTGKPFHENVQPISLQELTSRGLMLDGGKIIYGLPNQGVQPKEQTLTSKSDSTQWGESAAFASTAESTAPSTSSMSGLSTLMSRYSFIEPPINCATFRVGLDDENAFLRLSDTKHGKRYQMDIGDDFHLLFVDTGEKSSITILKNL